jgi:hypothetical protein
VDPARAAPVPAGVGEGPSSWVVVPSGRRPLCRGPSPLLRSDREGGRADEGDGLENGLRVAFSAAMRRPRRCAVCAESAGFLETAHQGASRVNQVWGADTRLRAVTRHFPAFSIMAAKVLGG